MNPSASLAIIWIRSCEVGAIREINFKSYFPVNSCSSPFSSKGISGIIKPSIPTSAHLLQKRSYPYLYSEFAYAINANGICVFFRSFATISKILSVVHPALNARRLASCITGPSAIGSENGIPISTSAAPAFSISKINSSVLSRLGSPAVINPINAFLLSNAFCILFM